MRLYYQNKYDRLLLNSPFFSDHLRNETLFDFARIER